MTKQQEIETLDYVIGKLGKDSYLGPWLSSVRHEVESLLRSDIVPELSLKEAVQMASDAGKAIVEQAKADAAKIVEAAQRTEKQARNEAAAIRERVACAIRAASREING